MLLGSYCIFLFFVYTSMFITAKFYSKMGECWWAIHYNYYKYLLVLTAQRGFWYRSYCSKGYYGG